MHPLDKFRYCPACGSKHFEIQDEKSKKCENCGFEYYLNPSAANVALIVNDKDELLVATRKKEPAKGTLDLPGGFADIGETAEEGVVREVKALDTFFICQLEDFSTLHASDDAAALQWIPITDIHTELFGLRSVRHGLYRFVESYKKP